MPGPCKAMMTAWAVPGKFDRSLGATVERAEANSQTEMAEPWSDRRD
jgi:hypothetical protein